MVTSRDAKHFWLSRKGRRPVGALTRLAALALWAGCASGPPSVQLDPARSHVYPLPLDNVLAQAIPMVEAKGWKLKRVGNLLVTNWLGTDTGTFIAYRIFGERIDAGLSSLRVERVVATQTTSFNTDHPYTTDDREAGSALSSIDRLVVRDAVDEAAVGTAPPPPTFSPADLAPPSAIVVTQRGRDSAMEVEFQEKIDPIVQTATTQPAAAPSAQALATAALAAVPMRLTSAPPTVRGQEAKAGSVTPSGKHGLKGFDGIWEGTFTFRGNVTGSYGGEVSVSVEDGSAEISDFCPDRGDALTATGSGDFAAWQGELACPPIPVHGCSSAVVRYSFAHADVSDENLTIVAAGKVDIPNACGEGSGALSVTFTATRAHYLYLAVNRSKERATCEWPSDWEDLESPGSMAMPSGPTASGAYLGIIRAKGARETDIDVLLRACRHRVRLNGESVSMRLATIGPRQTSLRNPSR